MRADTHGGPEDSTLQAEAGYIDARPQANRSTKPLAMHGRTIHLGQSRAFVEGRSSDGSAPLRDLPALAPGTGTFGPKPVFARM